MVRRRANDAAAQQTTAEGVVLGWASPTDYPGDTVFWDHNRARGRYAGGGPGWHFRCASGTWINESTGRGTTSVNGVKLSKMAAILVGTALVANGATAADWPRFRGPDCTGICPETGLVQEIPAAGLPLLWQIQGCGTGYSSVSIADGKIFTMGDRPDGGGTSQFVIAFDLAAHKELWATKIGPKHDDGSRCTPTIDGDRLYALGTSSDLVCLDANTGDIEMDEEPGAGFWRRDDVRLAMERIAAGGRRPGCLHARRPRCRDGRTQQEHRRLDLEVCDAGDRQSRQGWGRLFDDCGRRHRWRSSVPDDHRSRGDRCGGRHGQVPVGLQPHREQAWPIFLRRSSAATMCLSRPVTRPAAHC